MNKLLAVDLDGTLLYPSKLFRIIPKKNVKFLRRWIDAGNKLVMVSSRGPHFMERLKVEIERDFDYISYTSSYIVANGEVIRDVSISGKEMKFITDRVFELYKPLAYLMDAKGKPMLIKNLNVGATFLLFLYKLYWIFQGKKREQYILNNKQFDEELNGGKIYKLMVFFGLRGKNNEISREINKGLREHFTDVECSWTSIVNEITPKDCNKGFGLEYYCDYLKINPKDVYVVGDSGNDITMFNLFHENSYCMAKAYPSVKKYAAHTISRVYKLDKLVLEKEKNNE